MTPSMPAVEARAGAAFTALAIDGYQLHGFAWRHGEGEGEGEGEGGARPVVIINPATSVRCRYYQRFASWLFGHGFDVVTFDYRGIGESRPASLRGLDAGWHHWGARDFEGVLRQVGEAFPGQPLMAVGHSFGACAIGLAPSSGRLSRVLMIGGQYGFCRDYAAAQRGRMLLKWHLAMPLLTRLCGYFPGKRLGWLEDTPAGVVRDWTCLEACFEARPSLRAAGLARASLPAGTLTAPILSISFSDDPFATTRGIERWLGHFERSARTHARLEPAAFGLASVGHFAYFHSRHERSLWPLARQWLQQGQGPVARPGLTLRQWEGKVAPVGQPAACSG